MKYYIDYIDSDGDVSHYWCIASSQEEAEQQLEDDCWDVDTIINIRTA